MSTGSKPHSLRLTTETTRERERIVLFNDALNTFYLRLYCVRHMVKDIVRKETRCHHIGYSYRLTARITHTTAFVTPVVEH